MIGREGKVERLGKGYNWIIKLKYTPELKNTWDTVTGRLASKVSKIDSLEKIVNGKINNQGLVFMNLSKKTFVIKSILSSGTHTESVISLWSGTFLGFFSLSIFIDLFD